MSASSPFMSAWYSICMSSSGVRLSMAPPPMRPSPCRSSSCISRQKSSESPSSSWYCGPRRLKYTSNTVSKARQCALFFTSVAARAYLKASRSSIGMWVTASMASRFSVSETGRPAARSSRMKPAMRSITSRSSPLLRLDGELLGRLGDVGLVLQQDVERLLGLLGVDVVDAEEDESAGPVDRLAHAGRLLQLELANRADDAGDLVGEVVADSRHLGQHDLLLAVEIGIVDVQVEAAALQGLGELARVVRRQEHERDLGRLDGAELGDRHLVVGQDLEEQRFGLDLDAVDLVDQQHHRLVGANRLEERTGEEELLAEDVVVD